MSLSREEMTRTASDFRRHLDRSRLDTNALAGWLDLDPAEVGGIVAMDGKADPATVWLVRDALEQAARDEGVDGGGWSVLTDEARWQAKQWFTLREVPSRG